MASASSCSRGLRLALMTGALALLGAAGLGAQAAPAAPATRVTGYSPFTSSGTLRPGLVARHASRGDCFTGSFAVHRAYRCLHGNLIEDPCFGDPLHARVVVCVPDPFSKHVTRLSVSRRFSNAFSARRGLAWALRLASGRRCVFFAGGATAVDNGGRRANYGCSHNHTILWGKPIRRHAVWQIRMSRSFTPGPERLVSIRTAIIGRA